MKMLDYKNLSNDFLLPFNKRNFHRQYAHIYAQRLTHLRPLLSDLAHSKWGEDLQIYKLCDLQKDTRCIVIGTFYKDQPLKPSILKEISEENMLVPPPPMKRFFGEADQLVLEDELQRIQLIGNIDVHRMVTGIVVAVLGVEKEDNLGKFQVEDVVFAGLAPQTPPPACEQDSWVAFLSGFDIGNAGDLGVVDQLKRLAESSVLKNVEHLVIAGNCLGSSCSDKDSIANQARYLSRKSEAASVESMNHLDSILKVLVSRCHVHLMPGEHDPANFIMPQQPLQSVMFPDTLAAIKEAKSAACPRFETVTNPYYFQVGPVELLGTSGQNLKDIYKYSAVEDCMEQLESSLRWGHMAPTCPDTLGCYPYFDTDPFIFKACPRVYFAGNQSELKWKSVEGDSGQKCFLLTIPKFSASGACVLLNLKTMECKEVKI